MPEPLKVTGVIERLSLEGPAGVNSKTVILQVAIKTDLGDIVLLNAQLGEGDVHSEAAFAAYASLATFAKMSGKKVAATYLFTGGRNILQTMVI